MLFETFRSPCEEKAISIYLDEESSHVGYRPAQSSGARLCCLHVQLKLTLDALRLQLKGSF
jgi:hypothetical protein